MATLDGERSPIIAAALCVLLFGGAGHLYLGQVHKAIGNFAISLVLLCVGLFWVYAILCAIDAWQLAKKMEEGGIIDELENGPLLAPLFDRLYGPHGFVKP